MTGLSPDDAAALARAAALAAEFRAGLADRPIAPADDHATALARFGGPVPETGAEACAVIEALAAAWGQNTPMAGPTPAAAAPEEAAGRWMLELLDLPREAGFGFTTGATMANAIGLAAARNALLARAGWDVEEQGLFGTPEVHVVLGSEAHSTVFMALRLLGFGAGRVVRVAADDEGRMRPEALAAALAPLAGPIIVVAQAGHINTGAFDPFGPIVAHARAKDAWVHVDGAFGLWARASAEQRALADGVEGADSWVTDGHKWLQVPYDSGYVFVRDRAALKRAMGLGADYLANSETARDPGDHTPELSRRARGFAAWAVLAHLGREGVAAMVARHCRAARQIAARLAAEPGVAVLNQVVLNQVAVAFDPGAGGAAADAATRETLARVQRDGVCYPTQGIWQGRAIMRISVSSQATDAAEANRAAQAILAAWRQVRDGA